MKTKTTMQTNNKDRKVSYTETEICANCGAWKGLHHYETMQCPKNGKEETRFDELSGKFYPQQWEQTTFLDSGKKILEDAAPDLLDALKDAFDWISTLNNELFKRNIQLHNKEGFKRDMDIITAAIKKATEQ